MGTFDTLANGVVANRCKISQENSTYSFLGFGVWVHFPSASAIESITLITRAISSVVAIFILYPRYSSSYSGLPRGIGALP